MPRKKAEVEQAEMQAMQRTEESAFEAGSESESPDTAYKDAPEEPPQEVWGDSEQPHDEPDVLPEETDVPETEIPQEPAEYIPLFGAEMNPDSGEPDTGDAVLDAQEPVKLELATEVPASDVEQENDTVTDKPRTSLLERANRALFGKKAVAPRKKAEQKPVEKEPDAGQPKNERLTFYGLDLRELDRDLSPEQAEEWNSIYASFRSHSILTGTVVGVDEHTFDMTDGKGVKQRRTVISLVIIGYRVKVIIPETEVWMAGEERPDYVTRSMVGAKVDYVVMNVDRENNCAIASRRMAMTKKRNHYKRTPPPTQRLVKCGVILSSRKVVMVNSFGHDLILTQRDLSYTSIPDLRTEYRPGQELIARLLEFRNGKPVISVKEVNPNPFDGAEQRHPVGSRRVGVIAGKYKGGVFCRLPDDTTCLCLYSNNHFDAEFSAGDTVLIYIARYNNDRKLIYGRIVGKR